MKSVRLIARLDIKGSNLIKGVHLEGLRVIGDPQEHALKYYNNGADEILFMDSVASLYGRNNLSDILEYTAKNIFVPITVGGGIRSIEDVTRLLRSGADKIAINTAAIKRPELISEIAETFGSQCIVLSIEAIKKGYQYWEAFTDNGREKTGINIIDWCIKAEKLGIGEILLTSVDKEGTCSGFDLDLIKAVNSCVTLPIIASGGLGEVEDIKKAVDSGANAVAIASMLHYKKLKMQDIHEESRKLGVHVRKMVL